MGVTQPCYKAQIGAGILNIGGTEYWPKMSLTNSSHAQTGRADAMRRLSRVTKSRGLGRGRG